MRKTRKLSKALLAIGLMAAVTLTSSTVYGAEEYDDSVQEQQLSGGYGNVSEFEDFDNEDMNGLVSFDFETGQTEFIPGYKPGADTYSDEDNEDYPLIPRAADNRRRVEYDTADDGNRHTVFIKYNYIDKNGETATGYGSGFLIGPNAVLTVGHLVYDKDDYYGGHWLFNAEVYPFHLISSSGNPITPYGYSTVKRAICSKKWSATKERTEDWGVLELNLNLGNTDEYIDISYQSGIYEPGTEITVNGYPGVVRNANVHGAQYTRTGIIGDCYDQYFRSYTTVVTAGDSGGPCLIGSAETKYSAIGISLGSFYSPSGVHQYSEFRRIDKALYDELIKYKTSTL